MQIRDQWLVLSASVAEDLQPQLLVAELPINSVAT
eukprot:SAG11_NODE_32138_length_286_cov_0.673797_1_plen_34_part_01